MKEIISIRFVYRSGAHHDTGVIKHKLTINKAENMIIQSVFPYVGNRISYRYPVDISKMNTFFDFLINTVNIENQQTENIEIDQSNPHFKISILYDDSSLKIIEGNQSPEYSQEIIEELNKLVEYREKIFIF